MGHKALFAAMLATGLMQVAPAVAQPQDRSFQDEPRAYDPPQAPTGEDPAREPESSEQDLAAMPPAEPDPGLAEQDGARPAYAGEEQQARSSYSDRAGDRGCDGEEADRLTQKLRRETEGGLIDRRAAEDLSDEIAHAEDLRQSYCASGMNEWRQERLDRQYAQIEDRLRYEEERGQR